MSDAPSPGTSPPLAESWRFGAPPARRRIAPILVALVVVLIAAAVGFLLMRSPAPQGDVALAMELEEGNTLRYRLDMAMRMTVEPLSAQEISGTVSQVMSWEVLERGADGTMTIRLRTEDLELSANGQTIPAPQAELDTTVTIAPDGRIVDAGDFGAILSGASQQPIPGTNQLFPLLPGEPVAPGDTWEKEYSAPLPFAEEPIVYRTENAFLRYEEVLGVQAAVIETTLSSPATRFSVDAAEAAALARLTGGQPGAQRLPPGLEIHYDLAESTMEQTAWLDPAAGELLRSEGSGAFDMTARFEGLPSTPGLNEMRITGSISLEMERL